MHFQGTEEDGDQQDGDNTDLQAEKKQRTADEFRCNHRIRCPAGKPLRDKEGSVTGIDSVRTFQSAWAMYIAPSESRSTSAAKFALL